MIAYIQISTIALKNTFIDILFIYIFEPESNQVSYLVFVCIAI